MSLSFCLETSKKESSSGSHFMKCIETFTVVSRATTQQVRLQNHIICYHRPQKHTPSQNGFTVEVDILSIFILHYNMLNYQIHFTMQNLHLTNQLHGLWNPEVQCCIHKGSPIIPVLSRINSIPHIITYFFKVLSDIVLPSTPRPP